MSHMHPSKFFQQANSIRYVVISNATQLPISPPMPPDTIDILTDNRPALMTIWGLIKKTEQTYETDQILSTGKNLQFRIFEKGKHVFPERFETRILQNAIDKENSIKVPDSINEVMIRLYWRLMYEGFLVGDPDRRIFMEYVQNHVGNSIRPKYRFLDWNNKAA